MSKQRTDSEVKTSKFWMTVEQAESPKTFAKKIPGEFELSGSPVREGFENEGVDRRNFMKVMGASALMASLAGCTRRPIQKIVPYVTNPEEIIPGQPNFYASADPATGYGLVLKTREGRPIKVDGNVDHPMNRGALNARGQAMIHDLYDPDRLRAPSIGGNEVSWEDFDKQVGAVLASSKGSTWLLTGTTMSPTLTRVVKESGIKHVMLDSMPMDDLLDGQAQSYGSRVFPRFRFDKADYVLSLGADFLGTWGSTVEYTKQFSDRRRLLDGKNTMSKLVVFEPVMTITGQVADRRHSIHPADALTVALSIAFETSKLLGRASDELGAFAAATVSTQTGIPAEVIHSVAQELVKHKGKGLVVAKDYGTKGLPLQNVVNYLNSILDNDGETVDGTNPSAQYQGSHAEFEKLLNAVRTGGVKTLIISGVNPVYLFADPIKVKETLEKVPNLIYFGSYHDETAEVAKFVAAESHAFEAWGDVSPLKDIYSIQQPTIRPLWQSRSLLEALAAWTAKEKSNPTELAFLEVQKTAKEWHGRTGGGKSFQDWWDDILMSGVVAGSQNAKGSARSYHSEVLHSAVAAARAPVNKGGENEFALVLTNSVAMGDGFQANNAGLQELPDPVSKNTWGNYLAMSPETVKKLGWSEGDSVKVETSGSSAVLPIYKQPGLREGVVAAHLGYGRRFKGRIGNEVGASFVNFTGSSSTGMGIFPSHGITGVRLSRTGDSERVPASQIQNSLEGRDIIFDTTLEEFQKNPRSGIETEIKQGENPESIWSGFQYTGYRWGMSIDLSSCTGCSACVVACSV
ncbi:MAG: molybdopterin dinucleotide binding domain-containing protein, partial [Bdellovibrionota bacterium]